ncbi:MAG: hydrogenase maturation protease [bacterium]
MSIENRSSHILLLGVGNEFRGDDAAGILIARALLKSVSERITVREIQYEASTLVELLKGWHAVIVVDAAQSGGRPGTIRHFDVSRQPLPAMFLHASTHAIGPAEAIELSRALGHLPRIVHIIAIEGKNFEMGSPMSVEVQRALPELEQAVNSVIESLRTVQ